MPSVENKMRHHSRTFGTFIAFKEYFNFSGRRYQLIDANLVQDKICLNVERVNSKHRTLLNLLKVVSCVSLIIPLIMAVGSRIMHQKYSMIVDKEHVNHAPDLHGTRALSPRIRSLPLTQASSSTLESSDREPATEEEVNSQDWPDTSTLRSRPRQTPSYLCAAALCCKT